MSKQLWSLSDQALLVRLAETRCRWEQAYQSEMAARRPWFRGVLFKKRASLARRFWALTLEVRRRGLSVEGVP